MIEFGSTLRAAREAKGLTTSEIASRTHLLVQQVEALENEDFSRIAAPIYGRGFVRLYCDVLGIDSRPLIEEFMEIYNGNRDLPIKRRERTVPPPRPEPPPEIPPAAAPAEASGPVSAAAPEGQESATDGSADGKPDSQDGFSLESEPASPMPEDFRRYNPYVAPEREEPAKPRWRKPDIPPYMWRFTLLAAVGVAVIWVLFAGIRAAYRASMSVPKEEGKAETPPAEPSPPPQPAPPTPSNVQTDRGRTGRVPLEIPSLYID